MTHTLKLIELGKQFKANGGAIAYVNYADPRDQDFITGILIALKAAVPELRYLVGLAVRDVAPPRSLAFAGGACYPENRVAPHPADQNASPSVLDANPPATTPAPCPVTAQTPSNEPSPAPETAQNSHTQAPTPNTAGTAVDPDRTADILGIPAPEFAKLGAVAGAKPTQKRPGKAATPPSRRQSAPVPHAPPPTTGDTAKI